MSEGRGRITVTSRRGLRSGCKQALFLRLFLLVFASSPAPCRCLCARFVSFEGVAMQSLEGQDRTSTSRFAETSSSTDVLTCPLFVSHCSDGSGVECLSSASCRRVPETPFFTRTTTIFLFSFWLRRRASDLRRPARFVSRVPPSSLSPVAGRRVFLCLSLSILEGRRRTQQSAAERSHQRAAQVHLTIVFPEYQRVCFPFCGGGRRRRRNHQPSAVAA
jgi:hypothetical protein